MPKKLGLPKLPKLAAEPRPIRVEKHTVRPLGPKLLGLGTAPTRVGYGPGEPPPGFLNQWNSRTEWRYYWAVCKVKHSPADCRQPPFVGGGDGDWTYQNPDPVFGGRVAGGQVFDFIVWRAGKKVALRIQTERFHVFASSAKLAQDRFLKEHTTSVDRVMDLYDQNSISDASGRATIAQVVRALKGIHEPDPVKLGTARRVRA